MSPFIKVIILILSIIFVEQFIFQNTKNPKYLSIFKFYSSRGEPFPKSTALEPTEGYILTRSTFQEMIQTKKDILKICALKMLKRVLPFTLKLYYFFNWLTVKSGTVLYNEVLSIPI